MSARYARRAAGAVLAAVALGLTGCAENAPQDWLRPAGDIAEDIGNLWNITFWAAAAVFFVVEGVLLWVLFRFRDRRRPDEQDPVQIHGNTRLEVAWTIAPAVLLAALAVPTVQGIFALAEERPDSLQVTVTAHQWWWEYEYPDQGVITANELYIPVGRPVFLTLKSNDVIHSYWVPRLAGKQDVVPGSDRHMTLKADEPGWFEGQCVEYCGLSHAYMRLRARALPPREFEAWVRDQRAPPAEVSGLAAEGKAEFEGLACVGCHTIEGVSEARTGPDLTHFAARETFAGSIFETNEENLRRWLANPPEAKPGAKMPNLGLTEDQIDKLVAYLLALE